MLDYFLVRANLALSRIKSYAQLKVKRLSDKL